jgi:hypothetical protein
MFTDNRVDSWTSSSPHTGLLWALEVTAWSSAQFSQSINVLARLSEIDPGGRLSNRPFNSLKDIFRPWLPQTLVSRTDRLEVLATLAHRYQDVGPRLLIALLPSDHDTAMSNAKPKFRGEITGPPRVDVREWIETTAGLIAQLLPILRARGELWPEFLDHLDDLPPADRDRVYSELPPSIEAMNPVERVALWEKATDLIRRHREYNDAGWALPEDELVRFEAAVAGAKPADPRDEARWLFDSTHPDIGVRKATHLEAYDREVRDLRVAAIRRILDEHDMAGLEEFAQMVKYPFLVGAALAEVEE